jgi:hypothetical protein
MRTRTTQAAMTMLAAAYDHHARVTANDCCDIGSGLGSPVSEAYFDKAPYRSRASSTPWT